MRMHFTVGRLCTRCTVQLAGFVQVCVCMCVCVCVCVCVCALLHSWQALYRLCTGFTAYRSLSLSLALSLRLFVLDETNRYGP